MALTLDQLVAQSGGTKSSSTPSYSPSSLDALVKASGSPTAENSQFKVQRLQKQQADAQAKSQQANSVVGILKNTIAGLPEASGIPQAFKQGQQDTATASESFFKDKGVVAKAGDIGSAFVGAAEQLSAPFAPISNTIAPIINAAGNSIGNSSSNLPAFALSPAGQITSKVVKFIQDASLVGGTIAGGLDLFRGGVSRLSSRPEVPVEAPVVPREEPVVAPKPVESAPAAAEPVQAPAKPVTEAVTAPEAPAAAKEEPAPAMVDARASKAASDINQRLVDQGFKEIPFDEQAKYTPSTKAEQISRVTDLMGDINKAQRIALGQEEVPKGLHAQVVFNAVEQYAIKHGDDALLRNLANSPIAADLSESAQKLGSHGFNDNPNSPTKAIREIQKVREDVMKRRGAEPKARVVARAKKAIRSTHTVQTWSDFVKSIEC